MGQGLVLDLTGFVPVPGFVDYLAHPDGRIAVVGRQRKRALCPRICKATRRPDGYYKVGLTVPSTGSRSRYLTRFVHRIIALTFHGQPPRTDSQCAHLDGDRGNNRADNLKWCTPSENQHHTAAHHAGTQWGKRLFSPETVRQIRQLAASGHTYQSIGATVGTHPNNVSNLMRGKTYADVA